MKLFVAHQVCNIFTTLYSFIFFQDSCIAVIAEKWQVSMWPYCHHPYLDKVNKVSNKLVHILSPLDLTVSGLTSIFHSSKSNLEKVFIFSYSSCHIWKKILLYVRFEVDAKIQMTWDPKTISSSKCTLYLEKCCEEKF